MKILIFVIVILDLLALYRVISDEIYLLDNEKMKYIILILLIPIIGALFSMNKVGFKWLFFSSSTGHSSSIGYGGGFDSCDGFSDCGGSDGGGGD